MATDPGTRAGHPTIDPNSLYREEIFTDRAVGMLRVMHPVSSAGAPDPSRPTVYTGEAQLMTNVGPLPISFDIPGTTLAEAVANYANEAKGSEEERDIAYQAALPGRSGEDSTYLIHSPG